MEISYEPSFSFKKGFFEMEKKAIERKRRELRVEVSLRVDMINAESITRDVSASGVFIETELPFVVGDNLDFQIEFDSPGGKLFLTCTGVIVRVGERNGKLGVGVEILNSVMESAGSKFPWKQESFYRAA